MNSNQGDVLALLHRSNERGNVSAAPNEVASHYALKYLYFVDLLV